MLTNRIHLINKIFIEENYFIIFKLQEFLHAKCKSDAIIDEDIELSTGTKRNM